MCSCYTSLTSLSAKKKRQILRLTRPCKDDDDQCGGHSDLQQRPPRPIARPLPSGPLVSPGDPSPCMQAALSQPEQGDGPVHACSHQTQPSVSEWTRGPASAWRALTWTTALSRTPPAQVFFLLTPPTFADPPCGLKMPPDFWGGLSR